MLIMSNDMSAQNESPTDCCATPGLISVDQAIEKILSQATAVEQTESVNILDALNHRFHTANILRHL